MLYCTLVTLETDEWNVASGSPGIPVFLAWALGRPPSCTDPVSYRGSPAWALAAVISLSYAVILQPLMFDTVYGGRYSELFANCHVSRDIL